MTSPKRISTGRSSIRRRSTGGERRLRISRLASFPPKTGESMGGFWGGGCWGFGGRGGKPLRIVPTTERRSVVGHGKGKGTRRKGLKTWAQALPPKKKKEMTHSFRRGGEGRELLSRTDLKLGSLLTSQRRGESSEWGGEKRTLYFYSKGGKGLKSKPTPGRERRKTSARCLAVEPSAAAFRHLKGKRPSLSTKT